jgi:hypothetical protein
VNLHEYAGLLLWEPKVAGSNPVAPTIFRNQPFGEYVEGLSHCVNKGYGSTNLFDHRGIEVSSFRCVDATYFSAGCCAVQIPSPIKVDIHWWAG